MHDILLWCAAVSQNTHKFSAGSQIGRRPASPVLEESESDRPPADQSDVGGIHKSCLSLSINYNTMATFAKTSFNTAIYATFRPTYPRQLFDFIFQHHERTHGARWDTAVDLGCGTGACLCSGAC